MKKFTLGFLVGVLLCGIVATVIILIWFPPTFAGGRSTSIREPSPEAHGTTYLVNVATAANGSSAVADSIGRYLDYVGTADRAIDGDNTSGWRGTRIPGWLKVDFARPYTITRVGLWVGSHRQTYLISLSNDGHSWTVVVPARKSANVEGKNGKLEAFSIPPTTARFIKVDVTGTSAPGSHIFQASINELQAMAEIRSPR